MGNERGGEGIVRVVAGGRSLQLLRRRIRVRARLSPRMYSFAWFMSFRIALTTRIISGSSLPSGPVFSTTSQYTSNSFLILWSSHGTTKRMTVISSFGMTSPLRRREMRVFMPETFFSTSFASSSSRISSCESTAAPRRKRKSGESRWSREALRSGEKKCHAAPRLLPRLHSPSRPRAALPTTAFAGSCRAALPGEKSCRGGSRWARAPRLAASTCRRTLKPCRTAQLAVAGSCLRWWWAQTRRARLSVRESTPRHVDTNTALVRSSADQKFWTR